ncbi:sugar ABC transporter substrate-binding protein [Paenibacillus sp. LHD-38]|uniref:ABC transporter substrate-binding protein n=1 Tax=Paenibacillus sp. LHD-38 TaxID=3072143 RepID=UPI00280D6B1C|nr:sugar ABC transporter substrate-binding protein [Paenibacillus sp. LHD-38]MDQ8736194.1 sugar ABC transporter substrate-binding protein [Paenibacillus sp. LHD-38]
MKNGQVSELKKTVFVALSIMLVLSLLLAGCASNKGTDNDQTTTPKAKDKPVTIDFWYEGSGPSRTELYEGIIKEWNEKNPDIIVKGTYLALDSAMEKLKVSIAGGVTPDIVTIQSSMTSELFKQDIFVPLDEKFNAWDESKLFIDDYLDVIKNADSEGRLLSLPQAANMYGIWYRTDVFKEKGLESPGGSWNTFFTNIEKLTDKSNNTYGHTIRGGNVSVIQLLNPLIAYVGLPDFFDAEGKAQILRSPEAVEFINRYADVFKKGQAPQSSLTASFKEMASDFISGVSMSYVHNLGSFETVGTAFKPDQYGFAVFPKSPSTGKYTSVKPTVKSNAIFKASKHQDEAWEFMKFLASNESNTAINSLIGELPVRQDTMEAEWVLSSPHLKEAIPFLADNDKLAVRNPDYLAEFNTITKQVGEPNFQSVLTGSMTAEAFLEKLAIDFENAYANQK